MLALLLCPNGGSPLDSGGIGCGCDSRPTAVRPAHTVSRAGVPALARGYVGGAARKRATASACGNDGCAPATPTLRAAAAEA